MKLNAREDVEAPIAFVFKALADTDHWERAALRRGAEVLRQDTLPEKGVGMEWKLGFHWRERARSVVLRMAELAPDQRLALAATGEALEADIGIDLVEMGPRRTRIALAVDIKPTTLAARLFLQGLRLARGQIDGRVKQRMAQLAADIEHRHRKAGGR